MSREIKYPVKKYDKRHDVLHVYLGEHCNEYYSTAEEEYPSIYVFRDDDTDEDRWF